MFYFRKVFLVGLDNIPHDGPLIICGNHSNQFIDAIMVLAHVNRQISFTMAASSFSKKIIGFFAKLIKTIPVKRPEDAKIRGQGTVSLINLSTIKGVNTDFINESKDLQSGWSIMLDQKILTVINIIDKNTIEVHENNDHSDLINKPSTFFVRLFIVIIYTRIILLDLFSIYLKQTIPFYLKLLIVG
jgi:glycerol-3-phosphate O-acyltransferase / dihydroxyacetone phosphate acyltransferase